MRIGIIKFTSGKPGEIAWSQNYFPQRRPDPPLRLAGPNRRSKLLVQWGRCAGPGAGLERGASGEAPPSGAGGPARPDTSPNTLHNNTLHKESRPAMAAYQYIYVMKRLNKIFTGGRQVLKDISLSVLPGAKIGVLGLNGAGKSTLLRIMAGLDTDIGGEAWAAEGVRVGFLPQEPELDPAKDVAGNVLEGVAETKALLDKFEEVNARFAEEMSDDEMNDLIA